MKIAVLGDIHANLEALTAVVADSRSRGVASFYSVGDVVGYGPNPHECIEMLGALEATVVAGNHDWAVLGKIDINSFNPFARSSILWTMDRLNESDRSFLSALPLCVETPHFNLTHGTLHDPQNFYYMQSLYDAECSFQAMTRKFCFCGHSHVPINFYLQNNELFFDQSLEVDLSQDLLAKVIFNVGSVGQPRDGDRRPIYALFDTEALHVSLHRVNYDLDITIQKILAYGLPEYNAERLRVGH